MSHIVQAQLTSGWVGQTCADAEAAAALFDRLRTRYVVPVRRWAHGRIVEQASPHPAFRRMVDPAPA